MPQVTLSDICAEHRRRFPNRTAVVEGPVRLTWPELDDRVNQAARLLASLGVQRGDRVLWLAQTSYRFLEVMVACARIGAMVCPANWRQSAEEFAFVIDDFTPTVVLWQNEEIGDRIDGARTLASTTATWIQLDSEKPEGYDEQLAVQDTDPVSPTGEAEDALLVIYTAAIGGRPNGSMLSHRNLIVMGSVTAGVTGVDHRSVFINSGPLFHIGNFQFDAIATFLFGGTNVYIRRVQEEELLALIAEEHATSAFLMPPTIFKLKELNETANLDISSLRAGPMAPVWGDALPPDNTAWGTTAGGFGQTEVTGLAILNAFGGRGTGNSGRPSPFTQVRIVGPDGNEVPDGTAGEITIRGETVHLGYWNRPELNGQRMRDGWWHTTDLGRREPDGTIHFMGTMTRMIKSAAENIYPQEVEACLTNHPAVREAAIIGIPDPQFTQSVKAVVVLEPGLSASADDIIEHCRTHIASYKKPKSVEFIEAIPRVGGLTDYEALDAMFGGGGYPGGTNVAG
ncbi:long-chain acyl-CoA synthetase [Mycolicibacterium anyangense]|uniref:Long-chain acyl-CoA synthetase n=1 Tax=Mycolicibacterium anyangense TaxID=1431246 RepID=A0A6N4W495_9MYCO|nr:AMP-binding protein [Mycolicibacterium anyangense]BBZ75495.1 long-chain acyl-CoA synthetase [Mycolicibacterium anyangense]